MAADDPITAAGTEAFSIKIGLSIFAVTGCCSLCDELTGKGPSSPAFKTATVAVLEVCVGRTLGVSLLGRTVN